MSAAEPVISTDRVELSWRVHGAALAVLILLILFVFRNEVAAATQVWWIYQTYSHCFLIIPISLWLIWEQREQLRRTNPAVDFRVLWVTPALLLVWWIGELATINEVRQFAVIGLIQVAIFATLGPRVYRAIWFPALYLFFLVPTGQYLVGPMQRFATVFTDASLTLLNVPHHTEGTLIELTTGNFQIAEACAGLRFLIATVALGTLYAFMMFRKWYKVVLFLIASVVVPLVGNGLRCVGIILLAHFTNNKLGVSADHLVYGWVFNVAILLVLFLIGSLFRDTANETPAIDDKYTKMDTTGRIAAVLAIAAALISLGPAVARWHDSQPVAGSIAKLTRPLNLKGWHFETATSSWRASYPATDANIAKSIAPDTPSAHWPVDLYVAYYARADTGHTLTAHINYLWDSSVWALAGSGNVIAQWNGRGVPLQEWIISTPAERRIIWSTYWVDGRFTANPLVARLLQAAAAFQGRQGQALVAVSTVVYRTDSEARRHLEDALASLRELPDRLGAADHGDSSGIVK